MGRPPGRLRILAVLVLLAGSVVVAAPARACSCVPMDLERRIPRAEGAFVGTYVDRHTVGDGHAAWTFDVERVVKGSFGPTAIVRTNLDGAACGIELLDGPRTGLLLDRAEDGVWESSLCQQVAPAQLLAFARDSSPPDPAIASVGAGSSPASAAIGLGVLVAAVAGLWWWAWRRRRPAGAGDVT
jgi:hypothetical protein